MWVETCCNNHSEKHLFLYLLCCLKINKLNTLTEYKGGWTCSKKRKCIKPQSCLDFNLNFQILHNKPFTNWTDLPVLRLSELT
jgi:hypothetical protein